jgi:6-phosphogluconolactonase (cycloisomerase 2 family)
MIWRTLTPVLLFAFGNLARGETFVYLSVAAEKRIAVFQLDSETGELTHKSDCPVAEGVPGALTVDRRHNSFRTSKLNVNQS